MHATYTCMLIKITFTQIVCVMLSTLYESLRLFRVVVLNPTFNNISVISWRSVILMEETGVLGENHRPAASH